MPTPLRLSEVAHASHTGRVRAHNEDRSLIQPPLLAVADGVGGANAGEVAAQIAIDAVADLGPSPSPASLRTRLIEANTQIRNVASDDRTRAGMGTTMTAALLDRGGASLVHVGDSRAYLVRDGALTQLTDDHSLVAEMVRQGQLTPEEAATHPSRNVITRALGAEADVIVDEVHTQLQPGDVLLLCSDGLSSMIDDDAILTAITDASDLQDAGRALLSAALEAGGHDNVTFVLGRFATADGEAPVAIGDPIVDDATAPIVIPPPPEAAPKSSRAPVVLEPTRPRHNTRLRRTLALAGVVVGLVAAFATWVGSRTYFIDGAPGDTVRVYHGAPFDVAGLNLSGRWADTGLPSAAVRAVNPAALNRSALGQGEAVQRAVALVWTYGLPTVPEITVPPPTPAPASRTTPTPNT